MRIATTAAREDRGALYVHLAGVHEKLGALGVAFDVIARAAREFPSELTCGTGSPSSRNGRSARSSSCRPLRTRSLPPARQDSRRTTELDLSERAATLYEEALGEPERARPYPIAVRPSK